MGIGAARTTEILTTFILPTLLLAALYALAALAWVAIFQATGVLNLATGSFILLGPYFVLGLTTQYGVALAVALPIALCLAGAAAVVSYQSMLRPLAGRPILAPIIVTLGVSIALNALVQIVWGPAPRAITSPNALGVLHLDSGRQVPLLNIVIIVVSFAFVLAVLLVSRFTRLGILMRASAENSLRAEQLGIGIHRMASIGWGIAGVAAALTGLTYSLESFMSPDLALLGVKGLAPAMLGGFQSPGGAILGALVVAFLETGAVSVLGGTVREVVPFVVLLAILLVRPQGLFGKPTYLRV